ncbi:MAG: hypothetical protein VYD19_00715 [Myxococcota bacterium]|nr:hypothetical protein [Myxococcota bacterium]
MSTQVSDLRAALRLARTIASDILLYNEEKIKEALTQDALFEKLEEEISEGRVLYEQRVPEQLQSKYCFLERALVDQLAAPAIAGSRGDRAAATSDLHG